MRKRTTRLALAFIQLESMEEISASFYSTQSIAKTVQAFIKHKVGT